MSAKYMESVSTTCEHLQNILLSIAKPLKVNVNMICNHCFHIYTRIKMYPASRLALIVVQLGNNRHYVREITALCEKFHHIIITGQNR
uniref:Uncharacterized protein n=1 Tax=Octopus bimaculoides TaxID=37653 RepID=A0A0L8I0U7_OCTBM